MIDYFLCGSRSKLPHELVKNSDWDFAAPYAVEVIKDLTAKGYHEVIVNPDYMDTQTVKVYERLDINLLANVQISLKKDYNLFCKVWNSITPEFFQKYIWKQSPIYRGIKNPERTARIRDILDQLYRSAK